MKENGWILDKNKGVDIGWKKMCGSRMKVKGCKLDESKMGGFWIKIKGWKLAVLTLLKLCKKKVLTY